MTQPGPMDIHEHIASGLAALRAGRAADAQASLAIAWNDPDLQAAEDLADVRARVGSLYAQAALGAGQLDVADRACRDALRLLRRLGDRGGLDQVRKLQDEIVVALARAAEHAQRLAEQRTVASTPLAHLLAGVTDPMVRAELLVKKATAHADLGEHDAGLPLAQEALSLAHTHDSTQWVVLANLALVRLDPAHAGDHLIAAHTRADAADEFNLISTVARAATLAGVSLPAHPGPHGVTA